MMNMLPLAKVIRIVNCHLSEINQISETHGLEKFLTDKGFKITKDDGFFVTYENNDYKNANRNTIVCISNQGEIMNRIFGIVEVE